MPRLMAYILAGILPAVAVCSPCSEVADSHFGLRPPCRVIDCHTYLEIGWPMGGVLEDCAHERLEFCGRPLWRETGAHGIEEYGWQTYIGATDYSKPSARPLDRGSAEESSLVRAIRSALDRELSRPRQDSLWVVFYRSSGTRDQRWSRLRRLYPKRLFAKDHDKRLGVLMDASFFTHRVEETRLASGSVSP